MDEQTSDYQPPSNLTDKSRRLWSSVIPRRGKSPERIAMIEVALEALDRADQAACAIAKEGLTSTTKTSGTVHINPLIKIEREGRALFHRIWSSLGLHFDDHGMGRN